ncbi:DUF4097 family beta strand repeat-containing protein [Halobacterium litoreum]|uniref:DUF4097 domain-containing protein n=1 Tax=Halobacterium litoreum TaxID=2039234 RepID=A0ABD5NEK6_9EURY|nr:DUF4097 family beta strand repeat-containing protein [Halobacterium litoreum]UHH13505.1 DUF4097 domain-containing protein [Halobacterium litoreum]
MRRRALLAGVAAATAAVSGCVGGLFGSRVEETREREFGAPDGRPVRVSTENGNIAVETHDGGQVAVEAVVAVPSESRFEDVTVTSSEIEDALAVTPEVVGNASRVSVDLSVRVPEGAAMAVVQSENGDVTVRDTASVEAARSSNGDVTVRDAGPVESVSTENGDIAADVPAPLPGDVLLHSENGDVDAALSPDADAALDAQTTNGDVTVDGLDLRDASTTDTHVTGTLGDGTHEVTAATTNGDVTVEALD